MGRGENTDRKGREALSQARSYGAQGSPAAMRGALDALAAEEPELTPEEEAQAEEELAKPEPAPVEILANLILAPDTHSSSIATVASRYDAFPHPQLAQPLIDELARTYAYASSEITQRAAVRAAAEILVQSRLHPVPLPRYGDPRVISETKQALLRTSAEGEFPLPLAFELVSQIGSHPIFTDQTDAERAYAEAVLANEGREPRDSEELYAEIRSQATQKKVQDLGELAQRCINTVYSPGTRQITDRSRALEEIVEIIRPYVNTRDVWRALREEAREIARTGELDPSAEQRAPQRMSIARISEATQIPDDILVDLIQKDQAAIAEAAR